MSNFKLLLVYPNLQMVNLLPSNIAILSACLKEAGVEVKLFDTTFYRTAEKSVDEIRVEHLQLRPFNLKEKGVNYKTTDIFKDFEDMVDDYMPDLIGISATDDTFDLGISLVSRVRDKGIKVVVGGVFPTFAPDEALRNDNVDFICMGEGEKALVELCKKIESGDDVTNIKNIWAKKDGKIYKNAPRELVDIEALPCEDFSIFEEKRFFRPMQGRLFRMLPVTIDRGCVFNCSFCAAPAIKGLYKNVGKANYFRTKSVSHILSELEGHVKTYKADYIYFNSETFFSRSEEEIEQFAKAYASRIGLPFWCQTRVETITKKRVKILEEMNCDRISLGIEHGNEEFRKKILKKTFTNRQAIDAFKILSNSRIAVTVNNIIGFPEETRELVFDTINLNRKIKADSINAYFFVPYRGTSLREYCIKKSYISVEAKTNSLIRGSILNMPQFKAEEIAGLVRTFSLYIKLLRPYYKKIEMAEHLNEEGDKVFAELREVYFKKYFN